jgi:glutamate formiminotransferase/formiminotetrahydrofolate cyclodeaminase
MDKKLIECVPNISEGRNQAIIEQVAEVIRQSDGVKLLDVDPGLATNRTVITFVGSPQEVIDAAFLLIKKASELIDMSKHSGEHPRFGATDVCPLIPISGISMEETAKYARKLAERVGAELGIPVYCYENAATEEKRKNLANNREGEYEGLPKKLSDPKWKPDFGPAEFTSNVKRTGATAIGARDFLVAYNINLNTTSTRRANAIAFDIREAGRVIREGNPLTGKIKTDENGEPTRQPGKLKAVKGIGWYIEEYGIAQISYNLTNISVTPVHVAFDETEKAAHSRGIRVTGSELVGLIPLKAMLDAADYFLEKQGRSKGIDETEKIKIAVKSLGLDDLKPFDPKTKIIEYVLKEDDSNRLISKRLDVFADITASESPAPGGGSISAYAGALGAALGSMVANLSAHKRGWDNKWEFFSAYAEQGQKLKSDLLHLVDADTDAFNQIMEAYRLPKNTESEQAARQSAIQTATKKAIEIPRQVMDKAFESLELHLAMAKEGLSSSASDAAVGALCARAAVLGAHLNVKINMQDIQDEGYKTNMLCQCEEIENLTLQKEQEILEMVNQKIK